MLCLLWCHCCCCSVAESCLTLCDPVDRSTSGSFRSTLPLRPRKVTCYHYQCTLLIREVTSPPRVKGERNRLCFLVGYGKAVEEQRRLEMLPRLFWRNMNLSVHDSPSSSCRHGDLGEGGLRELLWPRLHLPWCTHNCAF